MTRYWLLGMAVLVSALSVQSCRVERVKNDAEAAKAAAVVQEGAAKAAQDTIVIVDRGRVRDAAIQNTVKEKTDAVLAAPGADHTLDPALIGALNDGLCGFAVTPGCDRLLKVHP